MMDTHSIARLIGRILLPAILALTLQNCALLSPRPAALPPASRLVSAEGTAHPDDAPAAADPTPAAHSILDDQVLQSHGRATLTVQFKYDREKIPSMPEIEELQTLAAARVRCNKLMADKIYHLPLERRQILGPTLLDNSPALKTSLEAAIMNQGRLEVLWNEDRTQVEGQFILPGKAVLEAIQQNLGEATAGAAGPATAADFREASPEQRRRLARERAIESARQNLRERLLTQPVRSNQTLAELIKRDPRTQTSLENFVRSAPLKSETVNPDGSITVVIEADAGRLMDLLR